MNHAHAQDNHSMGQHFTQAKRPDHAKEASDGRCTTPKLENGANGETCSTFFCQWFTPQYSLVHTYASNEQVEALKKRCKRTRNTHTRTLLLRWSRPCWSDRRLGAASSRFADRAASGGLQTPAVGSGRKAEGLRGSPPCRAYPRRDKCPLPKPESLQQRGKSRSRTVGTCQRGFYPFCVCCRLVLLFFAEQSLFLSSNG